MKNICLLLVIAFVFSLNINTDLMAKDTLVDKTILIINEKLFTKSQVDRIKSNFEARKTFSNRLYDFEPTDKNIVEEIIKEEIIKTHLSTIGFIVSDNHINDQIKTIQRERGISHEQLVSFLNKNNVSYDEYFKTVGLTLERDLFYTRTIAPLITITDQQVKNQFYQENKNNSVISFDFDLVSFSLDKSFLSNKKYLENMTSVVKNYRASGTLPPEFANLQVDDLGKIKEDGLDKSVIKILNESEEGDFTTPILIGNKFHVFLVKKKDLVESDLFLKNKDLIKEKLFESEIKKVTETWFKKEKEKNYIISFL